MFTFFRRDSTQGSNVIEIKSPVVGEALEITKIPDDVFSSRMMGDGIAVEPLKGEILAPADGTIIHVFPTKHAVGIKTNEGIEVLIHIGIDTVRLKGEGFTSFVKQDDVIKTGDKLIDFDLDLVKSKAKSSIVAMLVTNMDEVESINFNYGNVDNNSVVMTLKRK